MEHRLPRVSVTIGGALQMLSKVEALKMKIVTKRMGGTYGILIADDPLAVEFKQLERVTMAIHHKITRACGPTATITIEQSEIDVPIDKILHK